MAEHMRLALIFALVGSVLLHVDAAEARSGAPGKKRHSSGAHAKAKSKARTTHKGSKRSHKAPVEADEAVAVADEMDTPARAREVVAAAPSRYAVAQTTDDEEPAPAPKKKR